MMNLTHAYVSINSVFRLRRDVSVANIFIECFGHNFASDVNFFNKYFIGYFGSSTDFIKWKSLEKVF